MGTLISTMEEGGREKGKEGSLGCNGASFSTRSTVLVLVNIVWNT